MIQPDDDFDDDFEDGDPVLDDDAQSLEAGSKPDMKLHDCRRKIEDILEARKLREEFGDMDLY